MQGEIEIEIEKDIDLKNAMVIEGFPSIGVISTIATSYLVKALDLEYIGNIRYSGSPNAAVIIDEVPHPPLRIYAKTGNCGPDNICSKLVVMYSENPIPAEVVQPLSEAILDWCKERECGLLVSFEGIPTMKSYDDDETKVYGVGSNKDMNELLDNYELEKVKNGIVVGISGLLLLGGKRHDQNVVCILADADPRFPDSNGAVKLIEIVDDLIPQHKIDPEPLKKQAEELESSIKNAMSQAKKSQQQTAEVPKYMYG